MLQLLKCYLSGLLLQISLIFRSKYDIDENRTLAQELHMPFRIRLEGVVSKNETAAQKIDMIIP
jgi:hypothetical protein